MHIPEALKYTKDHEWVRIEDDILVIGITDFAQSELGDIVYVDMEVEQDASLEQEETFGTIEAVKVVSDLFMPISGTIVAINEALEDEPELVNQDPYNKGWMIKIIPNNWEDLDTLLDNVTYQTLIGEK